jgi:hypothetical protein
MLCICKNPNGSHQLQSKCNIDLIVGRGRGGDRRRDFRSCVYVPSILRVAQPPLPKVVAQAPISETEMISHISALARTPPRLTTRITMAGPNSDFKGFEEDFTGFPKHLPDDCVEYCLYVIDSKLKTPKELLGQLEVVKREALKLTDNLLKEYIWQRENFTLEIESGKGMSNRTKDADIVLTGV